jgi:2-iminobutanoate/2-iminopropanoate deaminase
MQSRELVATRALCGRRLIRYKQAIERHCGGPHSAPAVIIREAKVETMSKRQAISGPEIHQHPQPFPTAVKVGNMVYTAAVGGEDPATHELPESIEDQMKNVFQNVRNILKRAGGSLDNVALIHVTLRSRDDRKYLNQEWIAAFPDENDRPVRHTVADELPGKRLVTFEVTAVL